MRHTKITGFLYLALVLPATCLLATPPALADDGVQVGRYSFLEPKPTAAQVNPLDAVIQVSFPRAQIATVGDAVAYLLLRSGYHLGAQQQTEAVRAVLAMPLPEVHRQIGPYTVETALQVLMGQPYTVSVDHARRQIDYQLASAPTTAPAETEAKTPTPAAHLSPEPPAPDSAGVHAVALVNPTSKESR